MWQIVCRLTAVTSYRSECCYPVARNVCQSVYQKSRNVVVGNLFQADYSQAIVSNVVGFKLNVPCV